MSDKRMSALTITTALAGAISMAALMAVSPAAAGEKGKCYGIAKAGENDCANAAGTHSCAGHSTVDYFGEEWKLADSFEVCMAEGGRLKPFAGINEMKS